ncbi:MAG: hypothetical protein IT580_21085, partial [Verrucomicrobiales bacterium]|nr:hypothetical protein [Verrucomicrobiales bacterium]
MVLVRIACFGLAWLVVATSARAHRDPNAPVPSLGALHTDAEMTVDGSLDEAFWQDCPVGTGLLDQRTGKPAEDQTLIRVAYTPTHLYLAVECLDREMSNIHATE